MRRGRWPRNSRPCQTRHSIQTLKPPRHASLFATPSRIPSIPRSPPRAPATPPRLIGPEEITDKQRLNIGAATFYSGHHTVYQHAHFEFGLENISRQFVWSFLHAHPFLQFRAAKPALRPPGSRASLRPATLRSSSTSEHRAIYEQAIAHAWDYYRELSAAPCQPTRAKSSATSGTSARCPIPSACRKSSAPPKSAPSKSHATFFPSPPSPRWCTPSPASCSIACGA